MYMKKINSRGFSSLEIILIVVLVALIVGTGYFVYNSQKKSNSSYTNTIQSQPELKKPDEVALKTASFDVSFPSKLSFSYPENWSVSEDHTGPLPIQPSETTVQNYTGVSPSKNYTVKYSVGFGGGLGGSCIPEEQGTIGTLTYTNLSKFSGASFVEETYQGSNQKYTILRAALMRKDSAAEAKAGDSLCKLAFAQVIPLSDNAAMSLIDSYIDSPRFDKLNMTLEDIKSVMNTSEYKQATNILLSTVLQK